MYVSKCHRIVMMHLLVFVHFRTVFSPNHRYRILGTANTIILVSVVVFVSLILIFFFYIKATMFSKKLLLQ